MRVLVAAYGTSGNHLPFVGWSRELVRRGHEVVVLGTPALKSLAESGGADFFPIAEFGDEGASPSIQAGRGRQILPQLAARYSGLVPATYEAIRALHQPGKTVLTAISWMYGARLASELLDIPLVSVALQPRMLPPDPHTQGPIRRFLRRTILSLAERRISAPIHALQRAAGRSPARRIIDRWCFSPDGVLAFFPEWFAPQAIRDSEVSVQPVGFPFFDGATGEQLPARVDDFLQQGPPPVVLAQSTLGTDASRKFFATGVAALKLLGRRGLLITSHAEAIPPSLPPEIAYFGYVPISQVLSRCQAIVHHGGLGMIAQALHAGIPQVTVPGFLDQPDNCRHLDALGVSRTLRPRRMTASSLAEALDQLQLSIVAQQRCREMAARLAVDDTYARASAVLEQLGMDRGISDAAPKMQLPGSSQLRA